MHRQTFRSERIEPVLLNKTPSCRNTPNEMKNRNLKGQHFKINLLTYSMEQSPS
jgi:hypothetical protein